MKSLELVADLHTHTMHSDGSLRTRDLMARAVRNGVGLLAITDHDSVDAFILDQSDIAELTLENNLRVIPGIEISTSDETAKYHVLGIDINPFNHTLRAFLADISDAREDYARQIVSLMEGSGWEFNADSFQGGGTITKAHIARAALMCSVNARLCYQATGTERPTVGQLIEATLVKGKPFYRERDEISPKTAIDTIHAAGGAAILAHPTFNIMHGEDAGKLCSKFASYGVDGIEAVYIQHDRSNDDRVVEFCRELTTYADQHDLVVSGGSDFHTDNITAFGAYIDVGFANHPWSVPLSMADRVIARAQKYKPLLS